MAFKPIYLEPDEEITNVIDKVKSAPENQLALVLAKNSGLFQSLVNLKLLAKQAKAGGKNVVLITSNKVGQRLAGQVGLVTYGSLAAVPTTMAETAPQPPTAPDEVINGVKVKQYDPNRPNQPSSEEDIETVLEKDEVTESVADDTVTPPEPIHSQSAEEAPEKPAEQLPTDPKELPTIISREGFSQSKEFKIPWKSVLVGVGILVLLMFLAAIFLPRATVTVTFPASPISEKVTISAVVDQQSSDPKVIAGKKLTTQKTKTKEVTATGKKDVGTKASGTITITNKYTDSVGVGRDQTFTAGTKATHSSSGKVFTLNSAVTIGKVTYNPNNGQPIYKSQSAKVTAVEPGEEFNVAAGSFSLAGSLSNTPVSSGSAFSGGLTKVVTVLSQDDVDGAILKLRQEAKQEATTELTTKAEGQKILSDAIWEDVKEESAKDEVGAEVEKSTIDLTVEYGVIVFNDADATNIFTAAFNNKITADEEIVFPAESPPVFTTKEIAKDKSRLKFEIAATAFKVPKIDKAKIAKAIARKSPNSAKEYLTTTYKAESVDVKLSPNWWIERLPLLGGAITIEYGFSDQQQSSEESGKTAN